MRDWAEYGGRSGLGSIRSVPLTVAMKSNGNKIMMAINKKHNLSINLWMVDSLVACHVYIDKLILTVGYRHLFWVQINLSHIIINVLPLDNSTDGRLQIQM